MPLKNQTQLASEGCPLNTEWEVVERLGGGLGVAQEREEFEGCPRAVLLRVKPP